MAKRSTRGRGGTRRHDRREIEKLLTRRRREGLTYPELSVESGIPASTLQWWNWRLRREARAGGDRSTSKVASTPSSNPARRQQFVEVTSPAAQRSGDAAYEIWWPDGRLLAIPQGFSPGELRSLLDVLEQRC